MTNHFKEITTIEELKTRYKTLAKVFHPDMPNGNTAVMQEINNQYDQLFESFQNKNNTTAGKQSSETPAEYRNIINAIINLEGVEVELCGSWIWISGQTRQNKDILKSNGCLWASKKEMWYWRPADQKVTGKSKMTMEQIREKHGSEKLKSTKPKSLV